MAPALVMLIHIAGVLQTTNQDLGMKTNVNMLKASPRITSRGGRFSRLPNLCSRVDIGISESNFEPLLLK